jgi:chitodextrinase
MVLAGCITITTPPTAPGSATFPSGAAYSGPAVEFTWSPAKPSAGDAVSFEPQVKVLKGTGISRFAWSFGDGATATQGNAHHAFGAVGLKTVTLTVTASDGTKGSIAHVVPVQEAGARANAPNKPGVPRSEPAAPADPVIASAAGADPQTFAFSFTWKGEPDEVGWDFGDGTASQEDTPTHTYELAGAYTVALHVLSAGKVQSAVANVVAGMPYKFTEFKVSPAVEVAQDLYEPTMDVSDHGVLYLTAHVVGVDATGSPAFFSKDDGKTWAQLPLQGSTVVPSPVGGGALPPGDEMFIVAGDDGWAYGTDITLATYPVNAWSGDGAKLAYHSPNAYNEADEAGCFGTPIKDRPWAAYSNGTLLMVNNQGGGPAQVGVLKVPPEGPVGLGPLSAKWNLCAGPGGSIPGIPDLRRDGLFAVPQMSGGALDLVLGHVSDVKSVQVVEAFKAESSGEVTQRWPVAAFDGRGVLYAGTTNNTKPSGAGDRHGFLRFATSIDSGKTFVTRTFPTGDRAVRHFYMDGNHLGPGALVVWAVDGKSGYDWYTAQLQVAADSGPVLDHILLAIDEGPQPSADVTGAAVGPDGRAYLAMHRDVAVGATPLSVFVQQGGPTLPIDAR